MLAVTALKQIYFTILLNECCEWNNLSIFIIYVRTYIYVLYSLTYVCTYMREKRKIHGRSYTPKYTGRKNLDILSVVSCKLKLSK